MLIEIDNLIEASKLFELTVKPEEIKLEDDAVRIVDEVAVSARASRKNDEVRLRGTLQTKVETVCDRCMQPVTIPVTAVFDERFIPQADAATARDAAELLSDDMHFGVYEANTIDLNDFVREQILLELASRSLCREDCKGLCPTCGADLNVSACSCTETQFDLRWAALAKLKEQQ